MIAMAAPEIMSGKESPVSFMDWRSWKLDRRVVGTNGAEAQAVYEGEDKGWKCRILGANLNGVQLLRGEQNQTAALMRSLLIMDSKGFFDACTRQESAQLGMKSAKDGVEALAVHDATQPDTNCTPTWCPGDLNLADMLTKDSAESRKVAALYQARKTWIIRFDKDFVSAQKQQKLRRAKLQEQGVNTEPEFRDDLDAYEATWYGMDSNYEDRVIRRSQTRVNYQD